MSDPRRTLPISPATVNLRSSSPDVRPTPRPSSDGIPRPIESPARAPAPPPAGSLTANLAATQFARGSDSHALPIETAQTMQFAAAVTKPMAANSLADSFDQRRAQQMAATSLESEYEQRRAQQMATAIENEYERDYAHRPAQRMAAEIDGDYAERCAERTSTNLLATSAGILACAPLHAIYDSYEAAVSDSSMRAYAPSSLPTRGRPAMKLADERRGGPAARIDNTPGRLAATQIETASDHSAKFVDDASTRLVAKPSPAAVATGVMRPNARVVFPAMPAVRSPGATQLASGTTPPPSTPSPLPLPPAPGRPGTLPPDARTAFQPAQQGVFAHPSSAPGPASNSSARTVFEPQPILAAARPAFPLPAPSAATQFERPGAAPSRAKSPVSLTDEKSRSRGSSDVQNAVQAALDKRRALVADSFRDIRVVSANEMPAEPTMVVSPLTTVGVAAREQVSTYEREAKTALLYMLLAVVTCVLAPVAWIHAEEQLIRSNALIFRIERAIGLALTLTAVAVLACGITVLVVR